VPLLADWRGTRGNNERRPSLPTRLITLSNAFSQNTVMAFCRPRQTSVRDDFSDLAQTSPLTRELRLLCKSGWACLASALMLLCVVVAHEALRVERSSCLLRGFHHTKESAWRLELLAFVQGRPPLICHRVGTFYPSLVGDRHDLLAKIQSTCRDLIDPHLHPSTFPAWGVRGQGTIAFSFFQMFAQIISLPTITSCRFP
jgi:hypothetical protein